MGRQKAFYDQRRAAGQCVRCTNPPNLAVAGKSQCQRCLDEQKQKAVAWQEELKQDIFAAYGDRCANCQTTDDLHYLRKRGFPPVIETLCRACHEAHHHRGLAKP